MDIIINEMKVLEIIGFGILAFFLIWLISGWLILLYGWVDTDSEKYGNWFWVSSWNDKWDKRDWTRRKIYDILKYLYFGTWLSLILGGIILILLKNEVIIIVP